MAKSEKPFRPLLPPHPTSLPMPRLNRSPRWDVGWRAQPKTYQAARLIAPAEKCQHEQVR